MNTRDLLENLLSSSQEIGQQGKQMAEGALGIPAQGSEREAALSGMGKGALMAGAAALLLGTKSGRKFSGTALKVGSLAALGGLAYKAYQNWQQNSAEPTDQRDYQPIQNLSEKQADERSLVILKAVIAAAKADGHIDDAERARIQGYIDKFADTQELRNLVQAELAKPLDPADVAKACNTPELANEVYLASLLMIDQSNFMEKTYLNELAKQLNLDPALLASLHSQTGSDSV